MRRGFVGRLFVLILICTTSIYGLNLEIGLKGGSFVQIGREYAYRTPAKGGLFFMETNPLGNFLMGLEGGLYFNYPSIKINAYPFPTRDPNVGKEFSTAPIPSGLKKYCLTFSHALPQRLNLYRAFFRFGYQFSFKWYAPRVYFRGGMIYWKMVNESTAELLFGGDVLQGTENGKWKDLKGLYPTVGAELAWRKSLFSSKFNLLVDLAYDYPIVSQNFDKQYLGDPIGFLGMEIGLTYDFGAAPIIGFPVPQIPKPPKEPIEMPAIVSTEEPTPVIPAETVVNFNQMTEKELLVFIAENMTKLQDGQVETKEALKTLKKLGEDTKSLVGNYLGVVKFASSSTEIDSIGEANLLQILGLLNKEPSMWIIAEGYSDSRPSTGSVNNTELSIRRAQAVKNWFIEKGISEFRIQTVGYGDRFPHAPDNALENNRCVIIRRIK